MFQSFIIYTIAAVVSYNLCLIAEKREIYLVNHYSRSLGFYNIWFLFSLLLFAFIAGFRYNVGVDYLSYLSEYLYVQEYGSLSREDFEVGFKFITFLFGNAGFHYFYYFAFLALLQIGFIFLALKDDKPILKYVCLYIFLGTFFLEWMNGIRQTIVCCIFVYLVKFIEEKKLIKYLIGIAIAYLMHKSVLLLLPVYFLSHYKGIWNNTNTNLVILFALILIGANPYWVNSLSSLQSILNALDYGAYAENISYWVEEAQLTTWGPSRIGILLVQVIIIWFYPKLRVFYNCSRRIDLYFILFFFGVCAYNLMVNTSYIFIRPIMYFTVFQLPLFGYTAHFLKSTNRTLAFRSLILLGCSYTYYMILKVAYFTDDPNECVLYKFFFEYN